MQKIRANKLATTKQGLKSSKAQASPDKSQIQNQLRKKKKSIINDIANLQLCCNSVRQKAQFEKVQQS